MDRGSSSTSGRPRLVGRWPEATSPQRSRAGGGGVPPRRCSSGNGEGRPGSGVSVERGEASGSDGWGNAGQERAGHGELKLAVNGGW